MSRAAIPPCCVAAAAAVEARAEAIERQINPERTQPHSRRLPTDEEMAGASFACRQLRVAAEDIRNGLHITETTT